MAEGNVRLVWLLRGQVVLLSAQFLLGIYVNLFGAFPATDLIGPALAYGGDPVLTAHYALAGVLIVLGIYLVVAALLGRTSPAFVGLVVGGLASVLVAAAAGIGFLLSGFQSGIDSFAMATAFLAATSVYGVAQAMVVPGRPSRTEAERSEGPRGGEGGG